MSKAIEDAEHAKNILADEIFQRIFKSLEERLKATWKMTEPQDNEKREELYYELKALDSIQKKLVGYVENGIIEMKR